MCKAYRDTSREFDEIIDYSINIEGEKLSHRKIIKILKEKNVDSYRYSTRLTVLGKLEHLRAIGAIHYEYSTGKYSRKEMSLKEKRDRALRKLKQKNRAYNLALG